MRLWPKIMSSLIIWGAGGHGKVVLDAARSTGRFEQIVFLDDDQEKSGGLFCDCQVISRTEHLGRAVADGFVVAVGNNRTRCRCFSRAIEYGLSPVTIVHASAVVADSATIGRGTVVMPGVIINAGAVIGEDCIINSGAVVEHDCIIGGHVHISPRVALGGSATVGSLAHVGIGAVVLPGAVIGEESVVGAGAVVLKTAPARSTVVGVPAKALTYRDCNANCVNRAEQLPCIGDLRF
jgi:sugar O-acyltransferase (sialic acid O-acetyltransferase NeuD family)